jgi:hypothetical protein
VAGILDLSVPFQARRQPADAAHPPGGRRGIRPGVERRGDLHSLTRPQVALDAHVQHVEDQRPDAVALPTRGHQVRAPDRGDADVDRLAPDAVGPVVGDREADLSLRDREGPFAERGLAQRSVARLDGVMPRLDRLDLVEHQEVVALAPHHPPAPLGPAVAGRIQEVVATPR